MSAQAKASTPPAACPRNWSMTATRHLAPEMERSGGSSKSFSSLTCTQRLPQRPKSTSMLRTMPPSWAKEPEWRGSGFEFDRSLRPLKPPKVLSMQEKAEVVDRLFPTCKDHQADEKMLRANRGKPSAEQRRSRSQQATLAKEVSTRLYNHGAEKREKWERESQGALLEMRKAKLYPVSQLTFQQKDQLYRRSYPALRPTIDNVLTRTSK